MNIMTNIKYYNLDTVNPYTDSSIFEYGRIYDISSTHIFVHNPSSNGVDYGDFKSISDQLISGNIPEDYKIIRLLAPDADSVDIGSPVFLNDQVSFFNIHCPSGTNVADEMDTILSSVVVATRNKGIDSYYRRNDVYEDNDKKFCGILSQKWPNGSISYNFYITFKLDFDTIDNMADYTTWDNVSDSLSEIVNPIGSYIESSNRNGLLYNIAYEYAELKEETLISGCTLSKSEETRLNTLRDNLSLDSWVTDLIHPEEGQQQ